MGKLVPQDENDEPASVLLERIRKEKQRLIAEGKLKKDKHKSIIYRRDNSHYEKLNGMERCIDDEIPFDIPDSWAWERFGNVMINRDSERIPLSVNERSKLDSGIKASESVPFLSTYLGHDSLYETEKYLKYSGNYFEDTLTKFDDYSGELFPEVIIYE